MTISNDIQKFNIYRDFVCNRSFLSKEQCQDLITIGNDLTLKSALLDKGIESQKTRKCQVAWLNRDEQFGWLFDHIQNFIEQSNFRFYHFDIEGFEPLQYTVYSEIDDHYEMHIDSGTIIHDETKHRKLSFSLQLSDPDTYTGCNLEMWFADNQFLPTPKEQGAITVFNSSVPHRVTPLESGTRYVIVGWIYGPPLR